MVNTNVQLAIKEIRKKLSEIENILGVLILSEINLYNDANQELNEKGKNNE